MVDFINDHNHLFYPSSHHDGAQLSKEAKMVLGGLLFVVFAGFAVSAYLVNKHEEEEAERQKLR